MHNTLTILRAAAAIDDQFWFLPASPTPLVELPGADPLISQALRVAARLLAGLPADALANLPVILGTTRGSLETDRIFDRSRREAQGRYASPAAFARTLPSTIAAEIALTFHLIGPSLTLSAGAGSAALALRRAAAWMHQLQLPFCLAGGFDWITPPTPDPSIPAALRTAMLLLAPIGPGVGTLDLGAASPCDLSALQDETLDQLTSWIQKGGNLRLATSILLNR